MKTDLSDKINSVCLINDYDKDSYFKVPFCGEIHLDLDIEQVSFDELTYRIDVVGMIFSEAWINESSSINFSSLDDFVRHAMGVSNNGLYGGT